MGMETPKNEACCEMVNTMEMMYFKIFLIYIQYISCISLI